MCSGSGLNNPPRRRTAILAIPLVTTVAGLLLSFSCGGHNDVPPSEASIPRDSEIEKVRALLLKSDEGFPEVSSFVVPPEHVPRILKWFRPGHYIDDPDLVPWQKLGVLEITTTDGFVCTLQFYSFGKNPAIFTTNGVDFFWGNDVDDDGRVVIGSLHAARAVLAAYKAGQKQADVKE
jgi:hypothetical protein